MQATERERDPRAEERVLVKHYARLYPCRKFLKRNYVPIEMSVSWKWMGLRQRVRSTRCCIISALSTGSRLLAHRYGP